VCFGKETQRSHWPFFLPPPSQNGSGCKCCRDRRHAPLFPSFELWNKGTILSLSFFFPLLPSRAYREDRNSKALSFLSSGAQLSHPWHLPPFFFPCMAEWHAITCLPQRKSEEGPCRSPFFFFPPSSFRWVWWKIKTLVDVQFRPLVVWYRRGIAPFFLCRSTARMGRRFLLAGGGEIEHFLFLFLYQVQ